MFKLSKKADYGLIAVKHLAMHRQQHACSANEIAEEYGISATDRKSTRLNSSHSQISYAVFCLKEKRRITQEADRLHAHGVSEFGVQPDLKHIVTALPGIDLHQSDAIHTPLGVSRRSPPTVVAP